MKAYLGLDIGGTHLAGGLVAAGTGALLPASYYRTSVDTAGCREDILAQWARAIRHMLDAAGDYQLEGIGIAMPGPFDYENGISLMRGLNKYDALYGLQVGEALTDALGLPAGLPLVFENDAACFARGEYSAVNGVEAERLVAVTLGTGFGSAFLAAGRPLSGGTGVPPEGFLYHVPYGDDTAEEHFSARGLLTRYRDAGGEALSDVAMLGVRAEAGAAAALESFRTFGRELGAFMAGWLRDFRADRWVIGGGVSRSSAYFLPAVREALQEAGVAVDLRISGGGEQAAIQGAVAALADRLVAAEAASLRRSSQPVLPARLQEPAEGGYELYPVFSLGQGRIHEGWDTLADYIARYPCVVVEGYQGVCWDRVARRLEHRLRARGLTVSVEQTSEWFLPSGELEALLAPYLGEEDSVWGFRCDKTLKDLFDPEKITGCRPDDTRDVSLVVGPGAALADWDAPVIYLEVPKNEIQFRMRAGSVTNLGCRTAGDASAMYKRAYFIDWVLLNGHRATLADRISVLADVQRPEEPAWIRWQDFRRALEVMSRNVFRARPWFEPGAWGGQWLKTHIAGIAPDEVNYAWSFELITPENGVVLAWEAITLEASFDYLMLLHSADVLGPSFQERFGQAFPIRFDFLDTIAGGNLSIQCHPGTAYIREHFGEAFTQDETYYILEAEPGAGVYLGFQEQIDPAGFREALETSNREDSPVDIERFVQRHPARKHDLFLIPNGTVHSAAAGNLVLEISATPYIFTFKMYDWLRLDLNGDPRPINIAHAFNNLDFSRRGRCVTETLISRPHRIAGGADWALYHLPTHPEHFYDVHRYEFTGEVEVETAGSCQVLMVVEGGPVEVETAGGSRRRFHFAETFVIPAAAGQYRLKNARPGEPVKVVKAFLKASAAHPPDQAP